MYTGISYPRMYAAVSFLYLCYCVDSIKTFHSILIASQTQSTVRLATAVMLAHDVYKMADSYN